jgi:uncharacterized protein YkwD
MTRIGRVAAVLSTLVATGAAFAACNPAPNCTTIKANYADAPVKNISRANAEKAIWCLTNDERAAAGVAALTLNSVLTGTARKHGQDAVTRKWWTDGADPHVNPDGKGPSDRVLAAGYCPNPTSWKVAENVYWGWGTPLQTPRTAVTWWMGSTLHRATILDPTLKDLGVGVTLGAPRPPKPGEPNPLPDAAVFVQNFGACTN